MSRLARSVLAIAECAYERNDPKGAHFGCPKERRKVQLLAKRGLMVITTKGRGELYARVTNTGLTCLDKLRGAQ
jgi:aspartate oxidase